MNEYMEKAIKISKANSEDNYQTGGPFGAVIVKDGEIIASSSNSVLTSNDPTAHAEINAIRKAGQILATHDLSGCTLYTSCYPCPMCLSAIIWSNIKQVYYGNTKEDVGDIGFRDNQLYELLKDIEKNETLELNCLNRREANEVFQDFVSKGGQIY